MTSKLWKLFLTSVGINFAILIPYSFAYGECSQYGTFAQYDSIRGTCKCMHGYIFVDGVFGTTCKSRDSLCHDQLGLMSSYNSLYDTCECFSGYIIDTDILGKKSCQSANSVCTRDLGLHSRYNSLSKNCECDSGYYLQNGTCISTNDICTSKLGYNSRYNILTDSCECDSGYVLSQKEFGSGLECRSCIDKHGVHAEYNGLTKECECRDGYTPNDENQCVEKQNNVYFSVIELDDDNNEVVIRSDHEGSYFHIEYGVGCISFWRYEDKKIVVNLGTDFSLDTWDKIVLHEDDQTCNIVTKEKVDSDFKIKQEDQEELGGYYLPISENIFEKDIATSPYKDAIGNLKQKGIIGGYPDGTYKPKNAINRAEFIKIVMGAVGLPAGGSNCFSDVNDEWFAGYACTAKVQGITTGYPDGTFQPTNNINVAEALKIVLKAFVISVRGTDQGEEWFKPYVEVATSKNLYLLTFDSPDKKITREEMAELVNRVINLSSNLK